MDGDEVYRYRHVVRLVSETPWAILPSTLATISEILTERVAGRRPSAEEIAERVGAGPSSRPSYQARGVAILPLYGVLMPRASLMSRMIGATSLQEFGASLAQAVGNPAVDAILIDVDSPGGSVDLVPETAAQIREARATKPVVAVAHTIAASAAYWIAAQASELVLSPSAAVGSIGVFAAHQDMSAAMEKAGIRTTLISAGRYKVEGNPFEPLGDEARQTIQALVDEYYAMFVRDVARGRRTTSDLVRSNFGEGRMVLAKAAVAAGMADRIDTFDATLARLLRGRDAAGGQGRALLPEEPAAELGASVVQDAERDRIESTLRAFLLHQHLKEAISR